MSDHQYHCMMTLLEPSGSVRAGQNSAYLLIGTADEVANAVAARVRHQLTGGSGEPFTVTPVNPYRVLQVGGR